MKHWYQDIEDMLPKGSAVPPLDSVFPMRWIPSRKLLFHWIGLDSVKLKQLPASYFAEMSTRAEQENIRLIHVWEDVYKSCPQQVCSRIRSLCGNAIRIHGRATLVKRIHKPESDTFLQQHHLQGSAGAYYKYGLFSNDELIAVATFSKSRVMTDGPVLYRSYELVRFAGKSGYTINGGLSKLIRKFVEDTHAVHIMTYVDRDWGNGIGYLKSGFTYVATTPPELFFINPNTFERQYARFATDQLSFNLPASSSGNLKFVLDRRQLT